jgi:high-affinity iron transporter
VIDLMGETAWDSSAFLSEKSILGRVLHTLIGYSDQPTFFQLVVYMATLMVIYGLTRGLSTDAKPQAVGN